MPHSRRCWPLFAGEVPAWERDPKPHLTFNYRVTSLAGLLPPGSLVVIEGTIAQRATLSMPSLNWMISDPWTNPWTSDISSDLSPSTLVTGVVTRTAEEMRIIDFVPPALNSSYELEVRGPFLQCEEANDTQLAVFKFYQNESFNGHVLTSSTRPLAPTNLDTIDVWMGTIVSIFDPWLVDGSWANSAKNFTNSSLPDGFGSLLGYIPDFLKDSPYCSNNSTYANCLMIPRQLWMLTSNDSIVCTLGNATRTAQFSFVDGTQTVRYGELQDFEPVFVPKNGNLQINSSTSRVGLVNDEVYSYMAVFQSLAAKLIGSVTILLGTGPGAYQTSSILLTGLSACEEFSDNLWTQDYPDYQYIFNEPAYTCRNKTVAKAIEDLSANITISLMSSSNFTWVILWLLRLNYTNSSVILKENASETDTSPVAHQTQASQKSPSPQHIISTSTTLSSSSSLTVFLSSSASSACFSVFTLFDRTVSPIAPLSQPLLLRLEILLWMLYQKVILWVRSRLIMGWRR